MKRHLIWLWILGSIVAQEVLARGVELKGKWVEVETEHFRVLTNAGERSGKKVAESFEQIRQVFQTALPGLDAGLDRPIDIFSVRGQRTLRILMPARARDKKWYFPAGAFLRTSLGPKILVREETVGGESFQVVYHEFFHHLVSEAGFRLPVWIDEGLASFWGESRLRSRNAEVGRPDYHQLADLQTRPLLPLETLFTVDRSSQEYRDRHKVSLFYAQSWALTHYSLIGDTKGVRREQLNRYLQLVISGRPSLESAAEAFGDLEVLARELQRYSRTLRFKMLSYPAPAAVPEDAFRIRKVPTGEASALVAQLVLATARPSDAAELVDQARREAPDLPVTREASGLHRTLTGELEAALEDFSLAVDSGEGGPLAHYGFSVLRLQERSDREALELAERHLSKAITLEPRFGSGHSRLAEVYRRLDSGPERALEALREARHWAPDAPFLRLKEAQLRLEAGDRAEASELARSVVAEAIESKRSAFANSVCWRGSLWGLADVVLPACEKAVEWRPGAGGSLDSRGLARALTGDLEGAADDFRKGLDAAGEHWSPAVVARRERWLSAASQGQNLALEELEDYRTEPDEIGLLWWY